MFSTFCTYDFHFVLFLILSCIRSIFFFCCKPHVTSGLIHGYGGKTRKHGHRLIGGELVEKRTQCNMFYRKKTALFFHKVISFATGTDDDLGD